MPDVNIDPISELSFDRLWTNPSDFPTYEGDEGKVRADMQYLHDAIRNYLNSVVVVAVNSILDVIDDLVAGTVPDNSVSTVKLQNDAVTLAKLADEVTAMALGGAAVNHSHQLSDLTNLNTLTATMVPLITAAAIGAYVKPGTGIPKTDLASAVQTSLGKADTAYQKPSSGIPLADLVAAVQTSLGLADTAYQLPSGGVPTGDIADEAVTAAKLDPSLTYAAVGLTSDQVRKITAGTGSPSGGSNGDIYIKYTS